MRTLTDVNHRNSHYSMANASKSINFELWGLRSEMIGLAILLVAALWQAKFNDSLDKRSAEAAITEQRATNELLFETMKDIGGLIGERDETKLKEDLKVMQAKIFIAC